jgi:hypothetical protein
LLWPERLRFQQRHLAIEANAPTAHAAAAMTALFEFVLPPFSGTLGVLIEVELIKTVETVTRLTSKGQNCLQIKISSSKLEYRQRR